MPKHARRKKICWCTPSCGRLLTDRSRRRHYNALAPAEYWYKGDSESEDELSIQPKHQKSHRRSHHPISQLPPRRYRALSNISLIPTFPTIQDRGANTDSTFREHQPADSAAFADAMDKDCNGQSLEDDDLSSSPAPESESDSAVTFMDGKYQLIVVLLGLLSI
jgi:hypothetical protein